MQNSIFKHVISKRDCLALEISNSLKTKAMTNMSLLISHIKMTIHPAIKKALMGNYLVN